MLALGGGLMRRLATTTGRHVVVFPPGRWGAIRDLAEGHLAPSRFASSLGRGADTGSMVFDGTGHAVLETLPRRTREALEARRGVTVRAEWKLARPLTRVTSSPRATVLLDDAQRSWALQAIGLAADARDGAGIVVGLIDSGVDLTHPALAGSVSAGTSDGGLDATGHGTHCAGILVGRPFPGSPRYGIAPAAHVRSYRVFDANGESDEGRVRDAIRQAVLDGCRVLVLAAGVPSPDYRSDDAALGAWLTSMGAILFAAAGNESNRLGGVVEPTLAPANAPDVRAIGAVTAAQILWNSSNGLGTVDATRVDAVAPGVEVLSAWPSGRTLHMSGSSVATAIAGGVAAALWSRAPGLDPAGVYAQMKRMARTNLAGARDGLGDGALSLGN
jgi:subtilisin family serine protease